MSSASLTCRPAASASAASGSSRRLPRLSPLLLPLCFSPARRCDCCRPQRLRHRPERRPHPAGRRGDAGRATGPHGSCWLLRLRTWPKRSSAVTRLHCRAVSPSPVPCEARASCRAMGPSTTRVRPRTRQCSDGCTRSHTCWWEPGCQSFRSSDSPSHASCTCVSALRPARAAASALSATRHRPASARCPCSGR